jgi:hypothetical protein
MIEKWRAISQDSAVAGRGRKGRGGTARGRAVIVFISF